MDSLPIAFADDPEPERPAPPSPPPVVPLSVLLTSVAVGFSLLLIGAKFPLSWSIPRTIFNFFGCLLASPVLWLFFRAYHEVVPAIFVGQNRGSPQGSDSDAEFTVPVAA
jgi:protein-S-isoprenylcysteine O-methyltransferase Ste14